MKTIISLIMTVLALTLPSMAQSDEELAEQTIHQLAKATEERDVHAIHYLLHENFQAMKNESAVTKGDYMKMLWEKKLGGEEKEVEITNLELAENMASAKVKISGHSETTELYYYYLFKNGSGWQVLYILPYRTQKT
jgi:hypothetical protein